MAKIKEKKGGSSEDLSLVIAEEFKSIECSFLEDIVRIGNLYFNYLITKLSDYYTTLDKPKKNTITVLKILTEASFKGLVNLSEIQQPEQVRDCMRKISGLSELNMWLAKQKNAEEILVQSRQKEVFVELWKIIINGGNELYFRNLEAYSKKVKDLSAWLHLVGFMLNRKNKRDLSLFAYAQGSATIYWNKWKIAGSLLVSITLEINKREFTADDIYNFVEKFSNYDEWWSGVEEKIKQLPSESDLLGFYQSDDIKGMLAKWKKNPVTVFLEFEKFFVLTKKDTITLKNLVSVFEQSVRYLTFAQKRDTDLEKVLNTKTNSLLDSLGAKYLHSFFLLRQYLLRWISSDQLKKIMVYDMSIQGDLLKTILEFPNESLQPFFDQLSNTQMTLPEFLVLLWSEKTPFSMNWETIGKNRTNFDKGHAVSLSWKLERSIFDTLSLCMTDLQFNEFIFSLEEEGFKVDPMAIPESIALALYLGQNDVPKFIMKALEKSSWFPYVKDISNFKEYFREKCFIKPPP